jgi:hypothetical protein
MWYPAKVHCQLMKLPFWPAVEPVLLNMQLKQLSNELELMVQDVLMLLLVFYQ